MQAARNRGDTLDHVLLAGPPGLGKTTLAGIIATEMRVSVHTTSGPALERKVDVAGILTNLQRGRRAVRRRDPPPELGRRRGPLPGDGGLRDRHHDRRGPGGAQHPAVGAALHADRRHHAHRPAHHAAARPLRRVAAPRVLRRGRAGRASCAARPASSACTHRRRLGRRDRRPARAARRASPTGCCAACATSPRCATRASSRTTSAWPRSTCSRSTTRASTSSTATSC